MGLLLNRRLFLSQNSQSCQQPLAAFRLKQSAHPRHYLPIMPLPQSSMMPQVPPLAAQAPYLKICTRRGQVARLVQPQRVRLDTTLPNQLLDYLLPLRPVQRCFSFSCADARLSGAFIYISVQMTTDPACRLHPGRMQARPCPDSPPAASSTPRVGALPPVTCP